MPSQCQADPPRGLEGESAFTRQQSRHSGGKPSQTYNSTTYCLGVGQSHKPFSKVSPDLPQDRAKATHVNCDPSRFLLPHLHEFSLLTHPRSGDGVCYQGNWRRISLGSPLPRSLFLLQFSSAQFSVRLFATPCTAACQASVSITNSQSLLKLMSIKPVVPSNHLNLCCPLLLLPSVLPSIRVFSNESALRIRWPKDWSFSFSISPSNEFSGLISFRMDWFDLLAVQGTLKSLLQHHSSKASILGFPYSFCPKNCKPSHPSASLSLLLCFIFQSLNPPMRSD